MERGDRPAIAATMVVGEESDAAVPVSPGGRRPGHRHVDSSSGTRVRALVVLAVLVVSAAVAALLGRTSPRPDVQVADPFTDAWQRAVAAPAGPLAERWSLASPTDHELVGMAIVDDIVAVASRPRSVAEDSVLTVTAVGTRDGEARWRREIRGRDTLAVLEGAADGSDPILLANAGNQADLTGQYAWGWSGLAVLDARDGSMRWRRNLGIDATVQVRPAGALVVEERDGVAVVDGETGTTRLAWPSILDDADGHDWPRQARWTGSAWVVPTPDGWEVTTDAGEVEFAVTGVETWPAVLDDLVLSAEGSTVSARRRPDGAVHWQVDVGGRVMWIEPLDPDPPGDAGPPTRLLVYTTEDDLVMDGREPAPILVEDGEVVGPLDPGEVEALVRVPPGWTTMRLRLDGQAHTLCRPSPIDFGDDEGSCPDGLVLRDADGVALARADTDLLPDHDPSMTWRATDVGLLVLEPETVRLRRWTDLSEAWSLAVPGPWRVLPTVDTSASGVAIATPSSTPPRVTFHG